MKKYTRSSLIARLVSKLGLFLIPLALVSGCIQEKNRKIIEHKDLQRILVGGMLNVGDTLRSTDGTVCALYPYQQTAPKEYPHSIRINEYLKSSNYLADESHWALLVMGASTIEFFRFKRSNDMDILQGSEVQSEFIRKLPSNFRPVNCAPLKSAAVAKIELSGRIFLILGELK